jgi:hypothetical protein
VKLKYTKRNGGHLAVTMRIPIHLQESEVETLLDAYIEFFGERPRNLKTLRSAVHWFAEEGINVALSEQYASASDGGGEE